MIKQDLFFVANCLADGIVVTNEFASRVVDDLLRLTTESLFPSHREDAINALGSWLPTKQYAHLGKQALINLTAESKSSSTQIMAVCTFFKCSSEGSDEKREGSQHLLELLKSGQDFSLDQQIQLAVSAYLYSPDGSEEKWEGRQYVLKLLRNQQGLSANQQIQLIATLYTLGSEEVREGRQYVLGVLQSQQDLSIDQLLELVASLYLLNPSGSEEVREGRQHLLGVLQSQQDLSLDQRIRLVKAVYAFSALSFDEAWDESKYLLELMKSRQDLSLDQQVQLIEALYNISPIKSTGRDVAFKSILRLAQHTNISESNSLKLLMLPLGTRNLNFEERVQILQFLENQFSQEVIAGLIQENWKDIFEFMLQDDEVMMMAAYDDLALEVPYVIKLINNNYLPIEIRDTMLRILRRLVPLFPPLAEN